MQEFQSDARFESISAKKNDFLLKTKMQYDEKMIAGVE